MCQDTVPPPDPILAVIEQFLAASEMSATAFGMAAANDPALVHDLRQGRELRRATRARVEEFIAAALAE